MRDIEAARVELARKNLSSDGVGERARRRIGT